MITLGVRLGLEDENEEVFILPECLTKIMAEVSRLGIVTSFHK